MIELSVILPTHNPDRSRLKQTISGLQSQTLSAEKWELIVIDNNSSPALQPGNNWHPNYKLVTEKKQGLTYARLKGFDHSAGAIIVMVDDDNVLDRDYLKNIAELFSLNSHLGAAGGKSIPLFEQAPPVWLKEFHNNLALRDLGENTILATWGNKYPDIAPIGAGMAIRKAALKSYIDKSAIGGTAITDRTGNSLTSGGDNDIIIEILKSGWQVGYFPSLSLQHIIPGQRMEVSYLARLLNNTNKSWVQVLQKHGINPWKRIPVWTLPVRKVRAWLVNRAWQNETNYIKWQGICGFFDGLAAIKGE